MVAIRHPSCPRWNPLRTGPEVAISCVVVAARQLFAGGRGSTEGTLWSRSTAPRVQDELWRRRTRRPHKLSCLHPHGDSCEGTQEVFCHRGACSTLGTVSTNQGGVFVGCIPKGALPPEFRRRVESDESSWPGYCRRAGKPNALLECHTLGLPW